MKSTVIIQAIDEYVAKSVKAGTPFSIVFDAFVLSYGKLVDEMLQTGETEHRHAYDQVKSVLNQMHCLTEREDSIIVLEIFSTLYGDLIKYAKSIAPVVTSSATDTRDLCDAIFLGFVVKATEKLYVTWAAYSNGIEIRRLCLKLAEVVPDGAEASFALEVYRSLPGGDVVEILASTSIPYFENEEARRDDEDSGTISLLKAKCVERAIGCLLRSISQRRTEFCAQKC